MAYYKDVREYLEALENNDKLVRIKQPINKDTELHPLVRLQYRNRLELPPLQLKAPMNWVFGPTGIARKRNWRCRENTSQSANERSSIGKS